MLTTNATPIGGLDRAAVLDWYRLNRTRSRMLFDLVEEDAYKTNPIPLRHVIAFYEGHLPVFSFNTLIKKALGRPGIDERYERLFARGIDPEDEAAARASGQDAWPERGEILAYAEEADRRIVDVLENEDLTRPGHPLLDRAEAVFTILEHEAMHHETLLYIMHRLPYSMKSRPANAAPVLGGDAPPHRTVRVPAGQATLGAHRDQQTFGWDNEFPRQVVDVAAFEIDVFPVTNRDWLDFENAGGYERREWWTPKGWQWKTENEIRHPLFWERRRHGFVWRGLFEEVPLPAAWPVYVSWEEAMAYARWKGGRLPTEAEFHRAAYGTREGKERTFPWGEDAPDARRGNFDFAHWDPLPVDAHPAGASAWGVQDLLGNGWEWTSTPFDGFPGFRPMNSYPEYSADFFDREHYVMKGGSSATARPLLRPSFRNWFRSNYPYPYVTFRVARS